MGFNPLNPCEKSIYVRPTLQTNRFFHIDTNLTKKITVFLRGKISDVCSQIQVQYFSLYVY